MFKEHRPWLGDDDNDNIFFARLASVIDCSLLPCEISPPPIPHCFLWKLCEIRPSIGIGNLSFSRYWHVHF